MTANSKKVSELSVRTTANGADRFYIVFYSGGVPDNASITLDQLLRNMKSNTIFRSSVLVRGPFTANGGTATFKANTTLHAKTTVYSLSVANSGMRMTTTETPANGTTNMNKGVGYVWFDDNYMYRQVSNSVIKRVALSSF